MGEQTVTLAQLKANARAVLAMANKHGRVTVTEDGRPLMHVVVHQNAKPTRTRIHVGYRVVRMRDGVREWWTFDLPDWDVRPNRAHTWSTRTMPGARAIAKRFGGRVVKVFLSYRKGG